MPYAPTAAIPVQGARTNAGPGPSGQARNHVTRDDLISLGRGGAPERFLPLAAMALAQIPHDAGMRFLFAAHLARVGLRTLAEEQLDLLPPEAGNAPDVVTLRSALSGLPHDRVDVDELAATCDRNVSGLALRGLWLGTHFEMWRSALEDRECFRRLDGGLVIRPRGERDARVWSGLGADLNATRAAAKGLASAEEMFAKPAVISGLGSAAHALAAWEATSKDAVGYTPRLDIVEPDVMIALDGLASADLSSLIADERVEWFIGPDAIESFRGAWGTRLGCTLPGSILTSAGSGCPAALGDALRSLHEAQGRELEDLHARIERLYDGRDQAWWGRRFADARKAETSLRVLILTSRFSTFVRHSAADLAAAFARLGHRAEVSMEPDAHSRGSTLGTLRAVAAMVPDVIVLVNFARSACGPGVPKNVPFVSWIQDAMPHLFAPPTDNGPLDFVVGHLLPELFEQFGYRRENALPALVVADGVKFHPGPVSTSAGECEIALVSHHSEPPEAMHGRLVREAEGAPAVRRVFEALLPDVEAAALSCAETPPMRVLREASLTRLREVLGREPEGRTLALVLRTYAAPLADRFMRHQTVDWAAEAAQRRGWRLRLYGAGWEKHPTHARYAAGPIAHGEELRGAYQNAAMHLHVSLSTLVHQRVLECFLSGGFCASRMQLDAIAGPKTTAQLALLAREPDVVEADRIGYTIADHPEAMHLAALRARMGYPLDEPVLWIARVRAESMRAQGHTLATDHDLDAAVGDMSAVVFRSAAELEALAERAITNPEWRKATGRIAAERIGRTLTHEALAGRLIGFLTRRLNGEPA